MSFKTECVLFAFVSICYAIAYAFAASYLMGFMS